MKSSSPWPRRPFDPARLPFFYGWAMVPLATLAMIATIPGQTVGVGVFIDKLIPALGLDREQLALAYMFGTLASAFLLPFVGSAIDRFGTRASVTAAALSLGLGLWLFSHADLIPSLVASTWATLALTALFYLLLRFSGQGALTLVSRVSIAKWFNYRRGLATGIANISIAFVFNASPRYLNHLVLQIGWQNTYLVLALTCGLAMALIGLIFFRDNPEQLGMTMDGRLDPHHLQKAASRVPPTLHEFTRAQAFRSSAFWTYSVILSWQALLVTAFAFHVTSLGAEAGLDRTQAYAPFLGFGILGAATVAFAGWLSDRIRLHWLFLALVLAQILAALGILLFASPLGRVLLILGFGFAGGLFGLLLSVTWPRYFGRKHLGAISSVTSAMLVVASSLGPWLFESLREISGSYRLVTVLAIILPLTFLIPAASVRNPQLLIAQRRAQP